MANLKSANRMMLMGMCMAMPMRNVCALTDCQMLSR